MKTNTERSLHRLAGLHIIKPATACHEIARNLLCMQGQDFPGVLWSFGLRIPGTTEAETEAAFNRREIVRSWPLRGTLQVCAAEDLHWMLEHFAPKMIAGTKARQLNLQLDDAAFELSRTTIRRAFEQRPILTRDQILAELDAVGLLTVKQRSYHLIFRAALEGIICQGPVVDGEQAFVILDDWISPPRRKTREEALAELARRYLTSHGPATLADLSGWAGISAGDAKIGVAANGDAIEKLTVDGKTWYLGAAEYVGANLDSEVAASTPSRVHLLPGFDEFVLGYKHRDDFLYPQHADLICPGGNGVFFPTVVSEGRVVGTWKRSFKKKQVVVEASPFVAFTSAEHAGIASAAAHYAEYLGLELVLK